LITKPGTSASGTKGDLILKDAASAARVSVDDTGVTVTAPVYSATTSATGSIDLTAAGGNTIDGSTTGVTITGLVTSVGDIAGSATTDATTSLLGALKTAGGMGVQLKANVGGTLAVGGDASLVAAVTDSLETAGTIVVTDTTDASSATTGSMQTLGGVGVQLNLNGGGTLAVTGAAVFGSTMAVTGAVTTADALESTGTTDATTSLTGTIKTAGGLGVQKKAHIGGTLTATGAMTVEDTSQSSSDTTGAMMIKGGIGIEKAAFVGMTLAVTGAVTFSATLDVTGATTSGGVIKTTDTTQATTSLTGALQTLGGLGVSLKANLGGTLDIAGVATTAAITTTGAVTAGAFMKSTATTDATTTTSGSLKSEGGLGVKLATFVGGDAKFEGAVKLTGAESTPASASATCAKGTIVWDTLYMYVCTATNTWKRMAVGTWS
jgi:hypothetical protein